MTVSLAERSGYASFRPLAAAFVCAVAGSDQSVKLNGPLAQPVGGNVGYSLATPDGSRVVYRADQDVDERFELYSVPSDGSHAPVKLSDPSHGNVHFNPARITPDGSTVVYLTEEPALFRVPIDGSAAPLELASEIAFQDLGEFRFEISADSQWVVYREDAPARLLAVPTDGSQAPISLAPPGAAEVGAIFRLSPDSSRVVFLAGATDTRLELFSVPIDGSAAPARLNVPFTEPRQTASSFEISPDGLIVVHVVHDAVLIPDGYGGGEEVPVAYQLFRAAIDGSSAPVELSAVFPDQVSVGLGATPSITPDSARVLFLADTLVDGRYELFSLPLDGSSGPVRLNGDHASSGPYGIRSTRLTPDGRRVVYETSGREIFSAPVAHAGLAVQLCPVGAQVESFDMTSTGERVLFKARLPGRGVSDLFSVASDGIGGGGPRRIRSRTPERIVRLAQDVYDFRLHPDGTTAVFQGQTANALFRVGVKGGANAIELAPGFARFQVIPGERVLFLPFPVTESPSWQLYSLRLTGGEPVRLNPPLPLGPVVGRIRDFVVSPDGEWTVYLADGEVQEKFELYSSPTNGSLPARRISDAGIPLGDVGGYIPKPGAFRITPDSTRVVYLADRDVSGVLDLFVAPIDGSTPAIQLTQFTSYGGVQHGFEIAPDGEHAVFLALHDNGPFSSTLRLQSVRLDGSAPAALLSGTPVINGSVLSFAVSPDSSRVVYVSDEQSNDRFELFSVPLEGGAPVELQPVTTLFSDVGAFRISADGARVLYLFRGTIDGEQLYSIPIDGSAARRRFDRPDSMVKGFELTPDGLGVVYSLEQDASLHFVYELYLAPLDASSASLRLNPPTPVGPYYVGSAFRISPDGSRVAYWIDQEVDGQAELFSVPMDGSQTSVKLSAPLVPGASVARDFRISPDGSRVVFFTDTSTVGLQELYSVPIAGGELPARLNGQIAAGGGFDLATAETSALQIAGGRVAYALDQEVPGRVELYVAPLDGSRAAARVNAPLQGAANDALPFAFADANHLVYQAPQELPGIPELFARSLLHAPPHRRP